MGCLPQKPGANAREFTVNTSDDFLPGHIWLNGSMGVIGAMSYACGPLLNYSGFSNAPSFQYAYNADGTIASEGESNNTPRCYSYDKLGQLIFVSDDENDLHYSYNYDSAGNITSVSVQGVYHNWENYNNTYTYGNASWADLLTAFNGQNIAYEGQSYNSSTGTVTGSAISGNPISYYNGSRWTFSWQNGRQLASASKTGTSISYTYDLNSIRTSKTVNGVQHNYVYASGKLLRETYGSTILDFSYGINGAPYSLTYTNGSASPVTYYYITNLQNDVMYMVDANGAKVAEYKYDPFGKVITATGSMAEINPIRYRGYYYDTETDFYYLQTRYYDPSICRFINADSYTSTGTDSVSTNMFAYCNNCPIFLHDETGEFGFITLGIMAVGGLIGAAVSAATSAITQYATTGEVNWGSVGVAAASGFVSGALSSSPLGQTAQIIGSAILGGVTYLADCAVNHDKPTVLGVLGNVALGAVSGKISGPGANEHKVLTNAIESTKKTIKREVRRANQKYAKKAIASAAYSLRNTVATQGGEGAVRYLASTVFSSYTSIKLSKFFKAF